MNTAEFVDIMLWDMIEDGNETVTEALTNEIAGIIIEMKKQGKTFDETLVAIKERFPRENGEHIAPALNKAILTGFDVTGKAAG